KNNGFIDQIYFHIADSYAADRDIENAILNYNYSLRSPNANQSQKGLSYLSLAEIYVSERDFIRARFYYDSALLRLPQTFPDREIIRNKAQNLELLADRLSIIAREDSLQALAALPE